MIPKLDTTLPRIQALDNWLNGATPHENQLRQQVLRTGLRMVLLLIITGSIALYASYWYATQEEKRSAANNQLNTLTAQTAALEQRFNKAQQYFARYEELIRLHGSAHLPLDRQGATETLKALDETFAMHSARITFGPLNETGDTALKNSQATALVTDMTLTIQTVSDAMVMEYIAALPMHLPGIFRVNDMTLTRLQPLTPAMRSQIIREGAAPMVRAELRLKWYGIRNLKTDGTP